MGFYLCNDNWRDYIKSGERVLIQADIARVSAVTESIKPLLSVLVLSVLMWLATIFDKGSQPGFFVILPVLFIFGILWSVVRFLRFLGMRFVLTDTGIYKISGVVAKNVKYVAYKKITDVQISRNFIEQVAGLGSVGVSTASGGNMINGKQMNELTIIGVADYQKINELVLKKIK